MDPDFFAELEQAFTNVGREEIWERQIGDHLIKLSPISFPAQEKVNEVLANKDLGNNIVAETKRVALSHSILGIDNIDLTNFRDAGYVFTIQDRKTGKLTKVQLHQYIYEKLNTWGYQYIDDVFNVYADLSESLQKSNLKNIKFENLKDPQIELLELEERVSELRRQLGKPQLIENPVEIPEEVPEAEENDEEPLGKETEFDPFRVIEPEERPIQNVVQPPPIQDATPVITKSPVSTRTQQILESESGLTSTINPYVPPQANSDNTVVESIKSKEKQSLIDVPIKQSVNPRFSRQSGV